MSARPLIRTTRRAVALGALAWSATRARQRSVSSGEERIFRRFNDLDDRLILPLGAIMQFGSLGAVGVAGAITRRCDGRARAIAVAAGGTAVWAGVKLVKPPVGRGRPAAMLDGVHVRGAEQSGLGYPSGHSAVSTTLALVMGCGGSARTLALATAATTGAARMYVGAHLPLDIVGGMAIGMLGAEAIGAGSRRLATTSASAWR